MVVTVGLFGLAALPFSGARAAPEDHARTAPRAEGLVLARCGVCHSTDLIIQQRLDRSRWQATVTKMIQWGAELSEEEAGVLVEYLAARFHPSAPAVVPFGEEGAAEPFGSIH